MSPSLRCFRPSHHRMGRQPLCPRRLMARDAYNSRPRRCTPERNIPASLFLATRRKMLGSQERSANLATSIARTGVRLCDGELARPEGVPSNELFRVLGDWNAYLKQEK